MFADSSRSSAMMETTNVRPEFGPGDDYPMEAQPMTENEQEQPGVDPEQGSKETPDFDTPADPETEDNPLRDPETGEPVPSDEPEDLDG